MIVERSSVRHNREEAKVEGEGVEQTPGNEERGASSEEGGKSDDRCTPGSRFLASSHRTRPDPGSPSWWRAGPVSVRPTRLAIVFACVIPFRLRL